MNVGARNAFAANDLTAKFRKMTTAAATPRTTASKALVIESTSRVAWGSSREASVGRASVAWTRAMAMGMMRIASRVVRSVSVRSFVERRRDAREDGRRRRGGVAHGD